MRVLQKIPKLALRHKWKAFILIIFLYAGHKLYNIYKTWIQPLLGVYKSMKGDPSSKTADKKIQEEDTVSEYYDEADENEEIA